MEATGLKVFGKQTRIRKNRVILVVSNMCGSWCPRKTAGQSENTVTLRGFQMNKQDFEEATSRLRGICLKG